MVFKVNVIFGRFFYAFALTCQVVFDDLFLFLDKGIVFNGALWYLYPSTQMNE